jgi:hypothetical protein
MVANRIDTPLNLRDIIDQPRGQRVGDAALTKAQRLPDLHTVSLCSCDR